VVIIAIEVTATNYSFQNTAIDVLVVDDHHRRRRCRRRRHHRRRCHHGVDVVPFYRLHHGSVSYKR